MKVDIRTNVWFKLTPQGRQHLEGSIKLSGLRVEDMAEYYQEENGWYQTTFGFFLMMFGGLPAGASVFFDYHLTENGEVHFSKPY